MAELSPLAAGLTPRELSDIVRAHFGNTPCGAAGSDVFRTQRTAAASPPGEPSSPLNLTRRPAFPGPSCLSSRSRPRDPAHALHALAHSHRRPRPPRGVSRPGRLCKGEGTGAFPAREAFPLPVDGHSLHNYALLPLLFLPLYSIVVRFPRKNAKMRGRSVANS